MGRDGWSIGMRSGSRRAFTLMEAVIAFTLFTGIMLALGELEHAARRVLETFRGPARQEEQLATGFRQFSRDCAGFVTPGFVPPGLPMVQLYQSGSGGSSCSADSHVAFWTVEYGPPGCQEIRWVTYRIDGTTLVRTSVPAPEAIRSLSSGGGGGGLNPPGLRPAHTLRLVSGVDELCIELHDGTKFTDSWTGHRGVPSGIKLCLVGRGPTRMWARLFSGMLLGAVTPCR